MHAQAIVDDSRFQSKSLWSGYSQNFQKQPHIVLVPSYKERFRPQSWAISIKPHETEGPLNAPQSISQEHDADLKDTSEHQDYSEANIYVNKSRAAPVERLVELFTLFAHACLID